MPAPQLVTNAGSGVYYVGPDEDLPNIGAAFLAGFYGVYGRAAEKMFDVRMAALDPTQKMKLAAQMAELEARKLRMLTDLTTTMRKAKSKDYSSLLKFAVDIENVNTDRQKISADVGMKEAELKVRAEESGVFTNPQDRADAAAIEDSIDSIIASNPNATGGKLAEIIASQVGPKVRQLAAKGGVAASQTVRRMEQRIAMLPQGGEEAAQDFASYMGKFNVSTDVPSVRIRAGGGPMLNAGGLVQSAETLAGGGAASTPASSSSSTSSGPGGGNDQELYDLLKVGVKKSAAASDKALEDAQRAVDLAGRYGDPIPGREKEVPNYDFGSSDVGGSINGQVSTEPDVEAGYFNIDEGEDQYRVPEDDGEDPPEIDSDLEELARTRRRARYANP